MPDFAGQWETAQPVVAAFIWSLVPNRHDTDDLLQRTAETLFAKQSEYDGTRPFTAWALGIAKIEVLRFRQERGRDRLVFEDKTIDVIAEAYEETETELRELRGVLSECIDQLTSRMRSVLRMHHFEDLPPSTIAKQLAMTPNAVSVALHRARAALRDCVELRLYGKRGDQ